MFRSKTLSVGTLVAVLVIAVAGLGVGYGLWNEFLPIAGTVETGEVDAEFVLGAITEEDHGKEVGACTVTPSDGDGDGDDDHLQVTITNSYPSYECWVAFQVRNNGSVPIHIYRPTWTDLPPLAEVTVESTDCYSDDLQVHPDELSPECTLHVHIEQEAGENASYTFAANVEARQFNETRTSITCDTNALIDAINSANVNTGPDVIDLNDNCTYTLTAVDNVTDGPNSLPAITSEIVINGNGATVERSGAAGTPNFRIFLVSGAGDLTLNDMTVRNGAAGGIRNREGGTLSVNRSTISGNTTVGNGGGIQNLGAMTITDTTISGNRSEGGHPVNGMGGGIYQNAAGATLDLLNVTITANYAGWDGGGVRVVRGTFTWENSIIAHNTDQSNDYPNCSIHPEATWTSLGYNLSSSEQSECRLYGSGDQWNVNAMLGPLANNGGPTWTHALLTGSPAIDAGDNGSCPATDQRGVARPQGSSCDIGAYEYEP
jgi:hypothetical protein